MQTTLEQNFFNSRYFQTANRFKQKSPDLIQVFVEDLDDQLFWGTMFSRFSPNLKLEITPNSGCGARGKNAILKHKDGVGKNFIICVDSDYHYLLSEFKENLSPSEVDIISSINENPFIFQTYTYAIENYKGLPNCLKKICSEISAIPQNQILFNFEKCLEDFSTIIYPLFLYRISLKTSDREKLLCRKKFWDIISLNKEEYKKFTIDDTFDALKQKIDAFIKSLEDMQLDVDLESFEKRINSLGVFKHNVYLFIRGHNYISNVASAILVKVLELYFQEQKSRILNDPNINRTTRQERINQLNNRYKPLKRINQLLEESMNCDYECFLISKIKNDIEYFNQYFKNSDLNNTKRA